MEIIDVKIEDLACDPANVRKHPQKNLDAIKGSLKKFGQQKPIVIDEKNIVIAGNGTLEAAKSLGWKKIKCYRTDLKGIDKVGFAIADNRTSELAEWDKTALVAQLSAFDSIDFDIGDIGFNLEDLDYFNTDFNPDLPDDDENVQKTDGKKTIIIECKTMEEVENLFKELNDRGFKVKINI
jgi:ParB-like chromosome segregation protein Spo0J